MYMPSYLLFNHKAGSVSSIYSTFNFILLDLIDRPLPDDSVLREDHSTQDEGERDSMSRFPGDEENCFGEDVFPDSIQYGTTFQNDWRQLILEEARGTLQTQRGVLFYL